MVGALHVMTHYLAQVMEKSRPGSDLGIGAELSGQNAGDLRCLNRVAKLILSVAGSVLHPPEDL